MDLFYAPNLKDDRYVLSPEESRHCTKVLRLTNHDFIHLTDGRGTLYKAEITDANPKGCEVEIVERKAEFGKRPFHLHVGIAPTKNIKRFEWFLEKCTEIGIDEVTPLLCFHSERKQLKLERSNRIITSAMKQSLKAYHPVLNEMVRFQEFIQTDFPGSRYIAYCESENASHLKKMYMQGKNVVMVIGPEGDFSELEIQMARNQHFLPVSLGRSRLRTETAGIVACTILNELNE